MAKILFLMSSTALSVLIATLIGANRYIDRVRSEGYDITPQEQERVVGQAVNNGIYGAVGGALVSGCVGLSLIRRKPSTEEGWKAVRRLADKQISAGKNLDLWAWVMARVEEEGEKL